MRLDRFGIGVLLAAASAVINVDGVAAEEDDGSNLRPANIPGLIGSYWLYGWIGSYYNGTASFRLTFEDWGVPDKNGNIDPEETVCHKYRDREVTFSVDGLLAVTKPGMYNWTDNPAMLRFTTWRPGLDLVTANDSLLYPPVYDELQLAVESVLPRFNGHDNTYQPRPFWNLSTEAPRSKSSYALSGTSNGFLRHFKHTMPPCTDTVGHNRDGAWDWKFYMESSYFLASIVPGLEDKTHELEVEFGAEKASFQMEVAFFGQVPIPNGWSTLAGRAVIDFEGTIEAGRSDELVLGEELPTWVETVGRPDGDDDGLKNEAGRFNVWPCPGLLLLLSAAYYIALM